MSAKGYTDVTAVALALSRELTEDEQTAADTLIGEAEDYIDRMTGLAWMDGTSASETRTVYGGLVTLGHRPVSAITSVTTQYSLWSDPVVLTSEQWRLVDQEHGIVALRVRDGTRAVIAYTHDPALPPLISQAARDYVAARLGGGASEGITPDVKSYSIGGELTVTRFDSAASMDIVPTSVKNVIGMFKREHIA